MCQSQPLKASQLWKGRHRSAYHVRILLEDRPYAFFRRASRQVLHKDAILLVRAGHEPRCESDPEKKMLEKCQGSQGGAPAFVAPSVPFIIMAILEMPKQNWLLKQVH